MTTHTEPRLDVADLVTYLRESPFNRSCYTVDIALSSFLKNISMFTHGNESSVYGSAEAGFTLDQDPSRLFECVPPFQRDNDKWSEDMQVKFVENILKGFKTTLMFYEICADIRQANRTNCMVLDGLQRLTALHGFITGKFKVFGYTYQELTQHRVMRMNLVTIKLSDYTFSTEIEAVEFYITMNENITHSPFDIQRAKDYLQHLKRLELCD